jgi:N6-L-threonylcarbamoyladenine synthase
MIILGIETSCDETAISIIDVKEGAGGTPTARVLAHELISQTAVHAPFGGVFPMMAKREHSKNLVPLLERALAAANIQFGTSDNAGADTHIPPQSTELISTILTREPELAVHVQAFFAKQTSMPAIDLISVTIGPGLEPALWVGINFGTVLSRLWNIPLHQANHMEGHIVSALLPTGAFTAETPLTILALPALALLISGGHTELVLVERLGSYKLLGQTRDDAVGEAFDKVARILGLPYPGGPEISKLAAQHDPSQPLPIPALPRPMLHSKDFDFSCAGLKTAVLYLVQKLNAEHPDGLPLALRAAIAYDFEQAITEVLLEKTMRAVDEHAVQSLIIGGGVIANKRIRHAFEQAAEHRIALHLPHSELTTDNALMIALAGYIHKDHARVVTETMAASISAQGNMKLS